MIYKQQYLIFFIGFIFLNSCQKEEQSKSIIFVGDLLLDRGVRARIDYLGIENLFDQSVDSVFKNSDIVIANLECPATKMEQPINKRFIFRAEPDWLGTLQSHGITHLNLANNHSMDQSRKGLVDTHKNIKDSGLVPMGFGNNVQDACKAVLLAKAPRNVYVLSSLRVPSENWTYLENSPCVCEASIGKLVDRVKKLRIKEPNAVILIQLHWGIEHQTLPTTTQKQQAYQLIDSGADAVIGHHPHTVQLTEEYKGKPIYYSIGNFIFDQTNPINTKGIMVKLDVTNNSVQFHTIPFVIDKCVPKIL